MSQQHPMGTMADPQQLLRALTALEALHRMPTPTEHTHLQTSAGGEALWRLECAHHLAGAAEAQALMAAGCAVDTGCVDTILRTPQHGPPLGSVPPAPK